MSNPRLTPFAARRSSRGGFTLVELLVVIGIIAILAGVSLGPITRGIRQAQQNTAMQVTRQIGLMCFAYSNDNDQKYPFGAAAEDIANTLLNNNYATDPSVFWASTVPGAVKPAAGAAPFTLGPTNVQYDFMGNTTQGLTSTAADGTPLVQGTGGAIAMAVQGPIACNLTATKTAFGTDGLTVCYKSNSAKFQHAQITGATTATIATFVDSSYNDPNGATYKLITP